MKFVLKGCRVKRSIDRKQQGTIATAKVGSSPRK
jgi:hypothetical protein